MEPAEDRIGTLDVISVGEWCYAFYGVIHYAREATHSNGSRFMVGTAVVALLTKSRPFLKLLHSRGNPRKIRQIGFAPRLESPPAHAPLKLSFAGGFYGGSIGGGLSGLIIGITYYIQSRFSTDPVGPSSILTAFIYASLVGAVIGSLAQFFIRWFRFLSADKGYPAPVFNEIVGGIIGGMIGGAIVGPLGGAIYADAPGGPLSRGLLVGVSGLIGIIPLVLSVVLYEFRGSPKTIKVSLASLVIAAPIIAFLTLLLFWIEQIDFSGQMDHTVEGVLAGLDIGFMLGSLMGIVLLVDRLWNARRTAKLSE